MEHSTIKKHVIFFFSAFVCFGLISLALGQDANWDLSNYHYYNAYAFLNNRLGYDFSPAQIQTFHNPILYLPIYWLINFLPPPVVGFVLGGIQGFNIVLVMLIAKLCLERTRFILNSSALLVLIVLASASSPLFLSEIGTTFGDNIVSLFILTGIFIILRNNSVHELSLSTLFSSGFLMGSAAGLKLTNFSYVIAAFFTLAVLDIGLQLPRKLFSFAIAILLGFSLFGGYWMWILYSTYGNPFFPYYNNIFKSEYFGILSFKDTRWLPQSILHAFSYPFLWAKGSNISSEISFRDIKWAVAVVLTLISFFARFFSMSFYERPLEVSKKLRFKQDPSTFRLLFIILFTISSFIFWLFTFGYSRYIMPLDLLCPIYILCLCEYLARFSKRVKFIQYTLSVLLICIILNLNIPNWGRSPWRESWFGPVKSLTKFQENSIVLITSNEPISFVVPFLPSNLRFVRVEGNLFDDRLLIKNTKLEKDLKEKLEIKEAEYYLLSPLDNNPISSNIKSMGFTLNQNSCEYLYPYNKTLQLCKLSRF